MKNLRQLLYGYFTITTNGLPTSHPFWQDGKLCATNGKVLIRISEKIVSTDNNNLPMDLINEDRKVPNTQSVIPECTLCIPLNKDTLVKAIQKAELVDEHITCEDCHGEGTVEWEYQSLDGTLHTKDDKCPVCNGTGELGTTGKEIPDPKQVYKINETFFSCKDLKWLLDVMEEMEVEQLFIRAFRQHLMMLTTDETTNVEIIIASVNKDERDKNIITIPLPSQ